MSVTDGNADLQPLRSVAEAMADLEERGLVPDLTPPPVVESDTPIDAPFGLMIVRTPRWRVVDGFLLDDEIDISTRPRMADEADLPEGAYVTMPSPPKPAQPEHEGIPRGGRRYPTSRMVPGTIQSDGGANLMQGRNGFVMQPRNRGVIRADGTIDTGN